MGLKAFKKSGEGKKPGLAKRRALFPEGRGLGVGGKRESKKESKRKKKETHPAQWMGLKALITGLGVGERKSK